MTTSKGYPSDHRKTVMKTPLYENAPFFVVASEFGTGRFRPKSQGFEVYESGITHARLRATVGYEGDSGFQRAKTEADRLAALGAHKVPA